MVRFLRTGILAVALFCGAALALPAPAAARSHFSFSANIGLPLYAGDGYYRGGYFAPGWYGRPAYPHAYYSGAYYPGPYFAPRYYVPRPIYYTRPYPRFYDAPVVSLSLFPAVVNRALTREDRTVYSTATRRALAAPVGESMVWTSDNGVGGGVSGAVTTTRDGWAGARYCREFRQEITIDGRNQEAYGTACQMPNGEWQLVQNP